MSEQESRQVKPTGNPIRWLWRLFSSVRLALILILIIAGLGLVGALTPINVFNSLLFAIPSVALMVNILVCSLNRWKSLSLTLKGGKIVQPESFYKTGTELQGIKSPATEAGNLAEKVLRSRGYRVRKSIEGDNIHLAADKNRYFRLGTYFSHFSLILFVAAFLTGFHFGFHDTNFAVNEGETREVGHGMGLAIKLVSFTYEQYDNGMPKDYRSQVVLYENGQQVKEARIRVNHPLYYNGIRFYQSFFGAAAGMQVKDDKGQTLFDGKVPLGSALEGSQYFQGYFDLPKQGFKIRLIGSPSANDPMIPAGSAAIGIIQDDKQINLKVVAKDSPTIINGLEFTFKEMVSFSGFQVSRDPTNWLIWLASILFITGICAVFYFPQRQVWVLARQEKEGSRLLVRSTGRPGFGPVTEQDNFIREIEGRLSAAKSHNKQEDK
jgi:cytochrome c biogenesis protein